MAQQNGNKAIASKATVELEEEVPVFSLERSPLFRVHRYSLNTSALSVQIG